MDEFRKTSIYEEAEVELTAGGDGQPIRLPGAHYLLEHAYMAQDQEEEPPDSPRLDGAFLFCNYETEYTHDPYAGLDAPIATGRRRAARPGFPFYLPRRGACPWSSFFE